MAVHVALGGEAVLIDSVGAVLLISDDAERLAAFYRDALGFPLEDEVHDDVPLHYGCEIGGLHFAIHPSAGWPGEPAPEAQSPVIVSTRRTSSRRTSA